MNIQKKDFDYQFKLVVVGDTNVGKSSLLIRFIDNTFKDSTVGVIGVDFRFRNIKVDKHTIRLNLWDTAGQERFKTITSAYYRGADGIVIIFDITNHDSFRHVNDWLNEVNRYSSIDTTKRILIGNKCDLEKDRVVPYETAKALADSLGIVYIETSAKTNVNAESSFINITNDLLAFKHNIGSSIKGRDTIELKIDDRSDRKKSCC